MSQTFRIILYPNATPICEKIALMAARSNAYDNFQINFENLKRLLERERKGIEWVSMTDLEFKVRHLGDILLLIQKSEIFE